MYSLVRKCTDPSNMMLVIISMWLARWISPSFRAYLQKAIDPYKDGIETILHIGIPIFLSAGTIGFVTWMIGSWLSGTTHRILEKIGDRIDAITWNINSQRLVFKGYSWALVWIVSSHVLGMNETFIYFLTLLVSSEDVSFADLLRYVFVSIPFFLNALHFLILLPSRWAAVYDIPVQITNRLEVAGELKTEGEKIAR